MLLVEVDAGRGLYVGPFGALGSQQNEQITALNLLELTAVARLSLSAENAIDLPQAKGGSPRAG